MNNFQDYHFRITKNYEQTIKSSKQIQNQASEHQQGRTNLDTKIGKEIKLI